MEEYLEVLAKKYKTNKPTKENKLHIMATILLAMWLFSVSAEQNRRTVPIKNMEYKMMSHSIEHKHQVN